MSASVTAITAIIVACGGSSCAYTMADGFTSAEQCRRVAPMIAGMSRARTPALAGDLSLDAGRRHLYFECIAHGAEAQPGSNGADAPEAAREVVFRFSTSERLMDQLARSPWDD